MTSLPTRNHVIGLVTPLFAENLNFTFLSQGINEVLGIGTDAAFLIPIANESDSEFIALMNDFFT
jgi:hypothetical protein